MSVGHLDEESTRNVSFWGEKFGENAETTVNIDIRRGESSKNNKILSTHTFH